jgi:hypothetical protein
MPVWTPVVCSGCGSGKRQSSGQQLNERYTRWRDLREAIGYVFGIFPTMFLRLSLTTSGSTSLAIHIAVGDQLAGIPWDQSGDGKRLPQACGLCWDSPPRAPSRNEERCRGKPPFGRISIAKCTLPACTPTPGHGERQRRGAISGRETHRPELD